MRNYKRFLLTVSLLVVTLVSTAQCPVNENDLADGGTFSGTCVIAVGLDVTITGTVNWTSGTLTITGGSGRIMVSNDALLNVQGGTIITTDDGDGNGYTDGPIDVLAGGTINVSNGASIISAERITVDGTFNIEGNVQSLRSSFDIGTGGTLFVGATGSLSLGGTGDATVLGTMSVEGSVSTSGDVEINGGSLSISDNAVVNIGNDLFVYGGGSIEIIDRAVVEVAGNVTNSNDDPVFRTPAGPGSILVGSTLIVYDNLFIDNTTPDSELLGLAGGELSVFGGAFLDLECPTYAADAFTFCACTGSGETCGAVLPIELIDFTAEQNGNSVILKWSTASELNNKSFDVQRFNDADGVSTLVSIPGKGTTIETSHYSFIDHHPLIGNNYYQLKQTDFDGSTTYSKVIKHEWHQVKQALSIDANTNRPALLSIRATGFMPLTLVPVTVLSVNGAISFSTPQTVNEYGVILFELDTTNLKAGLYIIRVGELQSKFIR